MTSGAAHELDQACVSLRQIGETAFARLPLYRYLAGRAADDGDVAGLLLLAAPDDRNPTLLFASVHDRVLAAADAAGDEGADDLLGAWYPSVTDEVRPVGSAGDDPWPHFRRLVLDDAAVAQSLATRGTQTNEVGRCATTVPALAQVQREVERPIALVEVGSSAGLNLRLDAYGYRWSAEGGDTGSGDVHELAAGSSVVLRSRWRGGRRPSLPAAPPVISHRVGVDREPVDVTDPPAVRWLVACQWPEEVERLERCRAALALAVDDPPEVRAGDLLAEVAGLVSAAPTDSHPVVLSTWVLAYLSADGQQEFLATLDRIGSQRDVTLLVQESPEFAPGLGLPPRPDGREVPGPTALCRYDWRGGVRCGQVRLADQHPHGTWAEWFTRPR